MTSTSYLRRINLFDAVMMVMGGIIGAGIFLNPGMSLYAIGIGAGTENSDVG